MANIVVCIDPAYTDEINQSVDPKYDEGSVMYDIALLLKEEIEKTKGFKAVISKCKDQTDLSISDRISNATVMGANCFISLHSFVHHNYSMYENEDHIKYSSTMSAWRTRLSSENLRIGIYKSLIKSIKGTDMEEITLLDLESNLYIKDGVPFSYYIPTMDLLSKLQDTDMDSYVISLGYHTCHIFCHWIMDKDNQKKLAENLAKAIISHYTEE